MTHFQRPTFPQIPQASQDDQVGPSRRALQRTVSIAPVCFTDALYSILSLLICSHAHQVPLAPRLRLSLVLDVLIAPLPHVDSSFCLDTLCRVLDAISHTVDREESSSTTFADSQTKLSLLWLAVPHPIQRNAGGPEPLSSRPNFPAKLGHRLSLFVELQFGIPSPHLPRHHPLLLSKASQKSYFCL